MYPNFGGNITGFLYFKTPKNNIVIQYAYTIVNTKNITKHNLCKN